MQVTSAIPTVNKLAPTCHIHLVVPLTPDLTASNPIWSHMLKHKELFNTDISSND